MPDAQDTSNRACPKCGYVLKGLTSDICPECGIECTPALVALARQREKRRRGLIAMSVVAFILYTPHGWILFVHEPWDAQRWLWLRLWPVLPGLPATILLRFTGIGRIPDWVEFIAMGFFTSIALLVWSWIASRSRVALIVVIILLVPVSIYLGIVSHALYQL